MRMRSVGGWVMGVLLLVGGCIPVSPEQIAPPTGTPEVSSPPGDDDTSPLETPATVTPGTPSPTPAPSATPTPESTPEETTPPDATPAGTTPPGVTPTPLPGDDDTAPVDSDGDGYPDSVDCLDEDPSSYPGAEESCDGKDNDCDQLVDESPPVWHYDGDGDGVGVAGGTDVTACSQPVHYVAAVGDCDDTASTVYPGALESCNAQDDDCDGEADEGLVLTTWYPDSDGDGFGDPDLPVVHCARPQGSVADDTDCDDAASDTYPGAEETFCDGVDQSCLPGGDTPDDDLDGYDICPDTDLGDGLPADCDDDDASRYPDAPEVPGDGIDQACDGVADLAELRVGVSPGEGGDGGQALQAFLYLPTDMAQSVAGSLFIADRFNHRIRLISASGVISTFAGNGTAGYGGDGDLATKASLNYPYAVAVCGTDILISDAQNHRIRKVASNGKIFTLAGTGTAGGLGDGGPASQAQLSHPAGLACAPTDDGYSTYVADAGNNRVRRISASGNMSTQAGTGVAGFSGDGGAATSAKLNYPLDLALSSGNSLFISDSLNHVIRVVQSGTISTLVGTPGVSGPVTEGTLASAATLNTPAGLVATGNGNLYIADFGNSVIRQYRSEDKRVRTVVGTSGMGYNGDGLEGTDTQVASPVGLALGTSEQLFFADYYNFRVRHYSLDHDLVSTDAGHANPDFAGDGGAATLASLDSPRGIAQDEAGNLYLADTLNHRVRRITPQGVISTFAGNGSSTTVTEDGIPATQASLNLPQGLVVRQGEVFIAELGGHRVRKVSPSGIISTVVGKGSSGYSGDGGPATLATLNAPAGLLVDDQGSLYLCDRSNHRVRRVQAGIISTVAGTGVAGFSGDGGPATDAMLIFPSSLALTGDGALVVADYGNHRVRSISPDQVITTVAGTGTAGFSGDGGPATAASLYGPAGVAVDAAGTLFMADSLNHRVRAVTRDGLIRTVLGTGVTGYRGLGGASGAVEAHTPTALLAAPGQQLLVADTTNNRVIAVRW